MASAKKAQATDTEDLKAEEPSPIPVPRLVKGPVVRIVKFSKDVQNASQAHKDTHEISWDGVTPWVQIVSKNSEYKRPRIIPLANVLWMELEED